MRTIEQIRKYHRAYSRTYYKKHKDKISAYKKKYHLDNKKKINKKSKEWRDNNHERAILYGRIWRSNNKDKNYTNHKRWQFRNSEKIRAYQIVIKAIKEGKLKKGICKVCGSNNVHAHHTDYTKPLSVEWFCPLHHSKQHNY